LFLVMTDVETGITDLLSLFVGADTSVTASGVEWSHTGATTGNNTLTYETFVNGALVDTGTVDLSQDVSPPTDVYVGTISAPQSE